MQAKERRGEQGRERRGEGEARRGRGEEREERERRGGDEGGKVRVRQEDRFQ